MSDQWTDEQVAASVRRVQETNRAIGRRLGQAIERAFYDYVRLHRAAGHSTGQAAQMAVDDLNRAIQRT